VLDAALTPRSPLAGRLRAGHHGRPGAAEVTISEARYASVTALTARAGRTAEAAAALGLPPRPGAVLEAGETRVWLAPGQWLVFRERAAGGGLGSEAIEATDLSGARAVLRIAGPKARRALMKLVDLDLHPSVFAPGAAAATVAARIPVLLWCVAEDDFRLACYRSYGGSLASAAIKAALEFGCAVEA
jgi:sarcosine oxidase subunit gamma